MASTNPEHNPISARAAFWANRLNDNDLSDAEREKLQAWLLEDPRHASEFRAHNAQIQLAHEFPPEIQARLNHFIPTAQSEPAKPRRWLAFAAAAVLAVVIATSWLALRAPTYTTKTGENRTVSFVDGSVAYMNSQSVVQWLGRNEDRRARLGEGSEALFEVIHNPKQPFRVELDDSEIEVLGTRFNVYRKQGGEVTVTVLEGLVVVRGLAHGQKADWERKVAANQQIVYSKVGIPRVRELDADGTNNATKWREGVLVLPKQKLQAALSEFGRFTDKRIVSGDARVGDVEIGGVQNIKDVGATLKRLEKVAPLRVVETDDKLTIEYRDNK